LLPDRGNLSFDWADPFFISPFTYSRITGPRNSRVTRRTRVRMQQEIENSAASMVSLMASRARTEHETTASLHRCHDHTVIAWAKIDCMAKDFVKRSKCREQRRNQDSPTSDVSESAARRRKLRKSAFDDRREFVQVTGLVDNL
jgi:hypothetical protein